MVCRGLALVVILAAMPLQAWGQFGGMPGLPGGPGAGGPGAGFGGPPSGPPPACQQLLAMRDETQKNAAAIGAANTRKVKPELTEVCKLFRTFLATEAKFIQAMTDNVSTCGVPPQAIKSYQDRHSKASQIGRQICEAAAHQPPTGLDRPFLFDGVLQGPAR